MSDATVRSERLGAELHLGKLPAAPLRASTIRFAELLNATKPSLPPIPANFGHGYDFGRRGWLMLGNGPDDTVYPGFGGCGDCAWAGPAHEEMEAARNAGRPIPHFSGKTIVSQYSAYCGYDPVSGTNDTGSNVQDVLAWRQTRGLLDDAGHPYKIGQTVALTPGNLHELWAATYLLETVGIGIELQAAQMDQFDAGLPWDYVPGSPVDGGHYVPAMGNNGLISWAERVGFTKAFYEHQNDESHAYIDFERYNAVTGETAEHFTDQDLEKFIVLIAQGKAA